MSFIEGLTVLGALIGILALNTGISFYLFNSLQNTFNKRIDDLKELFKAELKPINEKLDNHITDTDKKIDALQKDLTEIKNAVLDKV